MKKKNAGNTVEKKVHAKRVLKNFSITTVMALFVSACQVHTHDTSQDLQKPLDPFKKHAGFGNNTEIQYDKAAVTNPGSVQLSNSGQEIRENIEDILEARKNDYDNVMRTARQKGLAGGAVRGGIIGLLLAGNPEGAFAGALVGGAIGLQLSERAASNLIDEHQNYLIRRWSLDNIRAAARNDTENTKFDLLLSEQVVENIKDQKLTRRSEQLLLNFSSRAESRVLALREIIPVYITDTTITVFLQDELKKQIKMAENLRKNIRILSEN